MFEKYIVIFIDLIVNFWIAFKPSRMSISLNDNKMPAFTSFQLVSQVHIGQQLMGSIMNTWFSIISYDQLFCQCLLLDILNKVCKYILPHIYETYQSRNLTIWFWAQFSIGYFLPRRERESEGVKYVMNS